MMKQYGEPSITVMARPHKLTSLEHIARMEEEKTTRRVLNGGISEKRRRERPQIKWLQAVERDLIQFCNQAIGLLGWNY